MYKITLLASVLALFTCNLSASDTDENLQQARKTTQQFGLGLKAHLKAAMKSGGPIKAIDVCNIKSPEVADYMSKKSGWTVARTSLKVRNLANQPDQWELKVLNYFETEKARGADPTKLEFSEIVQQGEQKSFRYMKAIQTGSVCLNCHAETIKPEVAAELKKLYPQDKARGYKVGDIRGAFTLEKKF